MQVYSVRIPYPNLQVVGTVKSEEQRSEQQHIMELQSALQKLPRVHLIVLDTLIKHLKE